MALVAAGARVTTSIPSTRRAQTYPRGLYKVLTSYLADKDEKVVFLSSDGEADSQRESEPEEPVGGLDNPEQERSKTVRAGLST